MRRYAGDQDVSWADGSRAPLGLEIDVDSYVRHIVEVMQAVRRVLRDDGTLWLNLGDSYAGSGGAHSPEHANPGLSRSATRDGNARTFGKHAAVIDGWADSLSQADALNLVGQPWRIAFALQADGWLLRSAIVWQKPTSMPESLAGVRWEKHMVKVKNNWRGEEAYRKGSNPERPQQDHDGKDFKQSAEWATCPGCPKCAPNDGLVLRRGSWRPTRSHEFVFMFAKGPGYYADSERLRTPSELSVSPESYAAALELERSHTWYASASTDPNQSRRAQLMKASSVAPPNGANIRDVWRIQSSHDETLVYDYEHADYAGDGAHRGIPYRWHADCPMHERDGSRRGRGQCKCTVSKLAHFAAFPPELVERCLNAGTSERGYCAACGAPWARIIDKPKVGTWHDHDAVGEQYGNRQNKKGPASEYPVGQTLGWRPTCKCEAPPIPGAVLDPFMGSGSTAVAARRLGLRFVGVDISDEYLRIAQQRLVSVQPVLVNPILSPEGVS